MSTLYRTLSLPLLLAALIALSALAPAGTAAAQEITTFILVRHSEKATYPAEDPGLTPQGKQRTDKLANLFARAGITAVYSTDFVRTRETARPLAERLGLEIESYDPRRDNLGEWLHRRNEGGTVLVVGHSNTTPALANKLLGEERFEQYEDSDYGNLLIVTVTEPGEEARVLHLRF